MDSNPYLVTRQRLVQAPPGAIFELLADPSKHPLIDGSGTVKNSRQDEPQRLSLGAEFGMDMRLGVGYRIQNTVVEFEENRLIAWRHFNGHRWRYELIPAPRGTLVRETWDASRLKRQWPLKVMGFTRSTPANIERTLDRLADYFDPNTPRPTEPSPPRSSKRQPQPKTLTPAQQEKEAAKKQARAAKAVQQDEEAIAAQAAKAERLALAQEASTARRAARAERSARAKEARTLKEAEKTEQAALAERARAEKVAESERAQALKAEQAAQEEKAKAEKAAEIERAQAEKLAEAERVKAEKLAQEERERRAKVARAEQAQTAKASKQEPQVPVEPLPPIGATARPLKKAPTRPAREVIAAAKAGRRDTPAPEPEPEAIVPEPTPPAVQERRPMAAARRMRRAS
ncbi:SRPBCC family protein [Arthrobacter rhombi]|uniref:SRPBCC family protein n=1 Tax=Arthrobacter rhombi TaxID=71253 RepID=UPI003FD4F0B9